VLLFLFLLYVLFSLLAKAYVPFAPLLCLSAGMRQASRSFCAPTSLLFCTYVGVVPVPFRLVPWSERPWQVFLLFYDSWVRPSFPAPGDPRYMPFPGLLISARPLFLWRNLDGLFPDTVPPVVFYPRRTAPSSLPEAFFLARGASSTLYYTSTLSPWVRTHAAWFSPTLDGAISLQWGYPLLPCPLAGPPAFICVPRWSRLYFGVLTEDPRSARVLSVRPLVGTIPTRTVCSDFSGAMVLSPGRGLTSLR